MKAVKDDYAPDPLPLVRRDWRMGWRIAKQLELNSSARKLTRAEQVGREQKTKKPSAEREGEMGA